MPISESSASAPKKRKPRTHKSIVEEKLRLFGETSAPFVRLRVEWCWLMPINKNQRLPTLRVGVSYCLRLSNRWTWMEIAKGLSKYFKAPMIQKEMARRERRAQTKYYASLRNPDADFYRSLSAKLTGKRDPSHRKYPPKDQSQRLVYVPRGPAKVAYRCGGRGLCKREVATHVWSEVDGIRQWRPVESVPRKHGGTAPDEEEKKEG